MPPCARILWYPADPANPDTPLARGALPTQRSGHAGSKRGRKARERGHMTYQIDPATIEAARTFRELADRAVSDWERHSADHTAAQKAVETILAAWREGDERPTGDDHKNATSEVLRTEMLRDRAANELRTRLSRAPLTNVDLAETVAERLASLFGDLTITITGTLPTTPTKLGPSPLLCLVQPKESHDEGGGQLAAGMKLIMYSDQPYKALPSTETLVEVLTSNGWRVDVSRQSGEVGDGVYKSEAKIEIRRGWLPLPYVDRNGDAKPLSRDNAASKIWQFALAEMLADEARSSAYGYTLSVGEPKAASMGTEVGDDNSVVERVFVSLNISARGGGRAFDPQRILLAGGSRLRGALVPYLGVITDVESDPQGRLALVLTAVRREPAETSPAGESDE